VRVRVRCGVFVPSLDAVASPAPMQHPDAVAWAEELKGTAPLRQENRNNGQVSQMHGHLQLPKGYAINPPNNASLRVLPPPPPPNPSPNPSIYFFLSGPMSFRVGMSVRSTAERHPVPSWSAVSKGDAVRAEPGLG